MFGSDLFLPDSQGIETFEKLHAVESQVPILIISEHTHRA